MIGTDSCISISVSLCLDLLETYDEASENICTFNSLKDHITPLLEREHDAVVATVSKEWLRLGAEPLSQLPETLNLY